MSKQARIGCLHAICSTLHKFATHSLEAYNATITDIQQLNLRLHASYFTSIESISQHNRIEDPLIVLTKGSATHNKTRAPKQSRKCSRCSQPGHTVRTCTTLTPANHCDVNISNNLTAPISPVDLTCVERTASFPSQLSPEGILDHRCSQRSNSLIQHSQTGVLFEACDLSLMGITSLQDYEHQMEETLFEFGHSLPPIEIYSTNFSPW